MDLTYKKILVAVDGSQAAGWAFTKAIEIAKRNKASLVLVHVIDPRNYSTMEEYYGKVTKRTEFEKQVKELAEEMISTYRNQAIESGIEIETIIEFGSPIAIIPKDIALKNKVDLIVCGATGMNAVERLVLGSVSERITRYATCDVLIVRDEKVQIEVE